MSVSKWSEADTIRAQEIWSEHQENHDLSSMVGQTAGIDPDSGVIWVGASIQEVIDRRDADGSNAPLFFVRIGGPSYYRKGGRR